MRTAAAISLLLPCLAGAEPLGASIEAQLGLALRQDPAGSFADAGLAGGLRAGLDVAAGETFELRGELSWLRSGNAGGTDGVQVAPTFDAFQLLARAGLVLRDVVPYLAIGPALTRVAAGYRIRDPVAGTREEASPSGLEPGLAYGLGAALVPVGSGGVRLLGRLEGMRVHRGASADVFVQLGAGIAF